MRALLAAVTVLGASAPLGALGAEAGPGATYYVGDGESFDLAVEVVGGKDVRIYLASKATSEPVAKAAVSLQPAGGPKQDVKFEPVADSPGVFWAQLTDPSALPGQIIIQTDSDTDAIETTVPKYAQVGSAAPPAAPAHATAATQELLSRGMLGAFAAGFVLALALLGLARLLRRPRSGAAALVLVAATSPAWLSSRPAWAHGGHDHGGPSLEGRGDTGGDVVMSKKSQFLIELRTIPAKKQPVPGVLKTYGHVIPKPQLDAVITAPQTGFLQGTQGLSLGMKVRRGQVLATLQAVGQIRIESPIDGEISEQNAVDGSRIEAGGKLFRVTDPSVLWVDAELFSGQLSQLKDVVDVQVSVDGTSGAIKARMLNAITPVSEETRTAKAFLELVTPPQGLRIGSLATIWFSLKRTGEAIPVPLSAVLNRAGDRIVFVQTGPETFVPRAVVVEDGPVPGTVLITQGVADGERVVTSGNYQLLMKAK